MKFLAGSFAPDILSQLRNYAKLMRLDRPIGIWLLLWPTSTVTSTLTSSARATVLSRRGR